METVTIVKSPSDTTIYSPAFLKKQGKADEVINQISNFVEDIRIASSRQWTPQDDHRRDRADRHRDGRHEHFSTSTVS